MTRPLDLEPAHRLGRALAAMRYAISCLEARDRRDALARLRSEIRYQDFADERTVAHLEAEERRLSTPGADAPLSPKENA